VGAYEWEQFMKGTPKQSVGAVPSKVQKEEIRKQLARYN
jgi:hypothetical protein